MADSAAQIAADLATLTARLVLFNTAINTIAGGAQEYQVDGRHFRRADLKELYAIETAIQGRIARLSSGRRGIGIAFGVPSVDRRP